VIGVGYQDRDQIENAKQILGSLGQLNVNLGVMTTYRVGGEAALYVKAHTEEDLHITSRAWRESGLPILVVGKGSNLLVADSGFPGIAVALGRDFDFEEMHLASGMVRVGGTVALPALARRCVAAGLSGFEWAVGVPGSIGGAVRMNAGGHGGDMQACVEKIKLFDLESSECKTLTNKELDFGYRQSAIKPEQFVLEASIRLGHGDREARQTLLDEIVQWRRDNQPGGQNAGSVFVNPSNETSGELLERLGLKGFRIGSAQVSSKHANFVQADVHGSADDVDAVIRAVAERVLSETGIALRTEIHRVGFKA